MMGLCQLGGTFTSVNEQLGSGLDKASSGLFFAIVSVVPFVVLQPVLFQSFILNVGMPFDVSMNPSCQMQGQAAVLSVFI